MNEISEPEQPGRLYIISAPSGAGKTSLVRALIASVNDIGVSVSHTTRPMRPDEVDGVNYHFIDQDEFKTMVDNGDFLEWATVFGYLYGTSKTAADLVLGDGKHLLLEIDWQGANQVRQKAPTTESIFIFPPSLSALKDRLDSRAQDDDATVEKRMAAAFTEISHYNEFDYLIVNDDFDTALVDLSAVIKGQGDQFRKSRQLDALKPLIADLLP